MTLPTYQLLEKSCGVKEDIKIQSDQMAEEEISNVFEVTEEDAGMAIENEKVQISSTAIGHQYVTEDLRGLKAILLASHERGSSGTVANSTLLLPPSECRLSKVSGGMSRPHSFEGVSLVRSLTQIPVSGALEGGTAYCQFCVPAVGWRESNEQLSSPNPCENRTKETICSLSENTPPSDKEVRML